MFDQLSASLQKIFRDLRGYGKLSESNISEAMREVRLALLEADVQYGVVKTFIARVKEQCLGEEVLRSVTPGQQVIRRVEQELTRLLGGERAVWNLDRKPAQVLLLGLHGAGKTSTAGKLARYWRKEGCSVLLAAGDLRRPAAADQLEILADQAGAACLRPRTAEPLEAFGRRVKDAAAGDNTDVVIYDTGGRFQIDQDLVSEIIALRNAVQPENTVLVLDAAAGQEAVAIATAFHRDVGLTGLILTKLDGDARGGAALSVQEVTGCRILLTATGERLEDIEPFDPARMASRILGMGDIVGLVEKAQAQFDQESMQDMEATLARGRFDLDTLLAQMRQLRKLGPLDKLLDMLPGQEKVPASVRKQMGGSDTDKEFQRTEAVILSMTPWERRHPERLNGSRRKRIALGSGTQVRDVNDVLKRFRQARAMAGNMKRLQKRMRAAGMKMPSR